jgi:hypothetical protein
VRADAGVAIRTLQPFNQPAPSRDPLWLVHELDRIDEHRLIVSVVERVYRHTSADAGALAAILRAPIGTPMAYAQLDETLTLELAITEPVSDHSLAAVPLLAYLIKYVESVVNVFGPAFATSQR